MADFEEVLDYAGSRYRIVVNTGMPYIGVESWCDTGWSDTFFAQGESADELVELYTKRGEKAVLEFLDSAGVLEV